MVIEFDGVVEGVVEGVVSGAVARMRCNRPEVVMERTR